ncbi:DNA-dependent metalloprotease WSS1 [Entomortierella parvispora]|uniref:DNA-dependent metalloprotease WSS1 n=1 Tax=Entomortierella parvispora TaxID=205924 RepID=A0A9P3HHD1_9FUNG|nr:DNA-dependent metalloprotease WSS1 [Entomortierella parvispora]
MASSTLDLVSNFSCLTSKNNHEEAMKMLKKVATMVRPIMKAHGWKITHLEEFFRKGLLGMNTNRGWKIQLCLRYHNDENRFLPWEEILGTMLHELAHNIRGPHDEKFYKALNDLNDEYDKVVASGYKGEGFDADGHRLGSRGLRPTTGGFGSGFKDLGAGVRLIGGPVAAEGLVTGGTRAAAVLAAEKRRQKNELMLPAGGRRLGGGPGPGGNESLAGSGGKLNEKGFWEQWHSPGELAALAAEQRAKDQVWCGSSNSSSNSEVEGVTTFKSPSHQTSTSSTPSSPRSTVQDRKPIAPTTKPSTATASSSSSTTPRRPDPVKRAVVPVVDLTGDASASASNIPSTKKPKIAPSSPPRPQEHTQQEQNNWTEWTCPACTLVNRPLALQCECCLSVRP